MIEKSEQRETLVRFLGAKKHLYEKEQYLFTSYPYDKRMRALGALTVRPL